MTKCFSFNITAGEAIRCLSAGCLSHIMSCCRNFIFDVYISATLTGKNGFSVFSAGYLILCRCELMLKCRRKLGVANSAGLSIHTGCFSAGLVTSCRNELDITFRANLCICAGCISTCFMTLCRSNNCIAFGAKLSTCAGCRRTCFMTERCLIVILITVLTY